MQSAADYLNALDHPLKPVALAVCALIRSACPDLGERIKWNAPSFGPGDEDRITLNLARPDRVRVIFHCGARAVDTRTGARLLPDAGQPLTWATDQRAEVGFASLAEVEARTTWLADLCRRWIAATGQDTRSGTPSRP